MSAKMSAGSAAGPSPLPGRHLPRPRRARARESAAPKRRPLERRQIVQMPDDRRIVVRASPRRAHGRARRARSACRRRSRRDRRTETLQLRPAALRRGDQRADRARDRRHRRRAKRHLDADMRPQPLPCPELRAIGQVGREETASSFPASGLPISSKPAAVQRVEDRARGKRYARAARGWRCSPAARRP